MAEICAAAAQRFQAIGADVEDGGPSFKGAVEIFQTLRAVMFSAMKADLLHTQRDALKPELIWNIEKGMALRSEEIGAAEIARGGGCPAAGATRPRRPTVVHPTSNGA